MSRNFLLEKENKKIHKFIIAFGNQICSTQALVLKEKLYKKRKDNAIMVDQISSDYIYNIEALEPEI